MNGGLAGVRQRPLQPSTAATDPAPQSSKSPKKIADERLPSRHTRMLGNAENDEVPGFFRRRCAMHLVGVRGAQPAVTAQVRQAREGGLVGARCHSVTLPLFFN